ncbi:MAG: ABC transporter substrate-binding protein [Desulfurococcales archaeon]|nr:ABC transporter substrate-binding protein [Desulfurococcales archaeon]
MGYSLYGVIIAIFIIAPLPLSIIALSEEASVYPEIYGEDIIRVGVTFSLSGKYTLEGLQALCGVKAAVDWINANGGIEFQGRKHRIQIVYFDDESDPDKAREYYGKLYGDLGIRLLLAPYSEELISTMLEAVNSGDALIAVYSPSSKSIIMEGAMMFQVSSPPELRFNTLIDLIDEKKINEPIVIFYKDGKYGSETASSIKTLASKAGISVAGEYPYTNPSDVNNVVESLESPVSVAVVVGESYEDVKSVVTNLYNMGLSASLVVLDSPASISNIYVDLGSGIAENMLVSVGWERGVGYNKELAVQYKTDWYGPEEDEWLNYYRSHCKTMPASTIAASASAALLLVANGIYWAGSDEPSRVWGRIGGLFTMTFYGPFKIDPQSGVQIAHENILVQWRNGEKNIVYPASQAKAELTYPASNWLRKGTTEEMATTIEATGTPADPTIIAIIIIIIIGVVALTAIRKRA